MFDSLLVPVDDTLESERIIPFAVAVAQSTGAGIEFLTVDFPNSDVGEMALYHRMLLDRLPDGIGGMSNVALGLDPVAEQLIDAYRRRPAALLALATRAPGSLWEWLSGGSVGDEIVEESLRPVLLVGPRCEAAADGALDRVTTAAVDGTALDAEVVMAATGWARALDTPLRFVRVTNPATDGDKVVAQDELVGQVARSRAAGIDASAEVIESFDPGNEILRSTERGGVLVVGSHRHSRLDRLVHGSNALWLTHRATVPVLVAGFALDVGRAGAETEADEDPERGAAACLADLVGWTEAG